MHMAWWIVYGLAVARLTGLATTDVLTEPLRNRLLRRLDPDRGWHEQLAYLITCQWCASIWIAAAVIPTAYWLGTSPWLQIPAMVLAASHVTGITSSLGRT
jgi:hypothetical protein